MMDCYLNELLDVDTDWVIQQTKEEDVEKIAAFYSELVEVYMTVNLHDKGDFIVIHNGAQIVKAFEEDGSARSFFNKIGLDLSHLHFMTKKDLQVLIIPCSIINDIPLLFEKMSKSHTIELWSNGEMLLENMLFLM